LVRLYRPSAAKTAPEKIGKYHAAAGEKEPPKKNHEFA
jgi:hypothetical protein